MLTQPTSIKASVGGRLATLLSRHRVAEVLSVHLLAEHQNLISGRRDPAVERMGLQRPRSAVVDQGDRRRGGPRSFTDHIGGHRFRRAGSWRSGTRCCRSGLNDGERGDRSPWLLGLVVRQQDRRRGIGGLLVSKLERLAADLGYRQVCVATGGEAVEFYRQCGWRDAQELRLVGTRIQTTILNKRVGTTLT
jgi:GNAT superfamily N-acetyltransferase